MNPLAYLQFFVPKRHALLHKLYRRMHRAYAWFLVASNPKLTIDQFLWGTVAIPIGIALLLFTIITIAVS